MGVGAGFLRVSDRVNERFYGAQVGGVGWSVFVIGQNENAVPLHFDWLKVAESRICGNVLA